MAYIIRRLVVVWIEIRKIIIFLSDMRLIHTRLARTETSQHSYGLGLRHVESSGSKFPMDRR